MIGIFSALIATLVTGVVDFMLAPGNHQHPPTFVIASSILMTCAGWLYVNLKFRIAGFVHAVFMFVVGGYLLFLGLSVLLSSNGSEDNAAAGTVAVANLVVAALGALTLAGGVAVVIALTHASQK